MKLYLKLLSMMLISASLISSCSSPSAKKDESPSTVSPKDSTSANSINGEKFENEAIGWTMPIPKGWKMMSDKAVQDNLKTGQESIEKSSGQKVDVSGLAKLLDITKDQMNSFSSNYEPFASSKEEDFLNNCKTVNKMLVETLTAQGIKSDTASSSEMVDGKKFRVLNNELSTATQKGILHQILYSTVIEGKLFSAVLTFNSDENKKELLDAFKASTFSKK